MYVEEEKDDVVETVDETQEEKDGQTEENDGNADNQEEDTDSIGDDDGEGDAGGKDTEDDDSDLHNIPLDSKVKLPTGEVVDASELLRGYMREEDYTKKTQELGEIRKQLALVGRTEVKGSDTVPDKKKEVSDEIANVKELLSELSEDDPQAKALSVVLDKLEGFENRMTAQEEAEKKQSQQMDYEAQVKNYQKFTNDALAEEAKKYQLPKYKDPKTGNVVDFENEWKESVMRIVMTVNDNMSLPEYRNLLKVKGREAYEKLRTIIGAITTHSAKKPKPTRSSSTDTGNDKGKKLTLEEKIELALDNSEKERTGG